MTNISSKGKSNMESNVDYYYDINRKLLSLAGQWPYQKPKEKRSFLILLLIFLSNVIFTQVAQFCICEDAQCIYQTLPPHMLAIMVLVKIFTFYFNRQKIKVLTDRLFIDWNMFENEDEREIMKKYAETGRWYSLIYASYVYIGTLSFTTTALVPRILDIVFPLNTSRSIMLAYPACYFVDEEQYFYYIFCHMLITAALSMTGLIAHDCMLFVYIEHVCGLFAVIGYRFKHLHKNDNEKKSMINYPNDVSYKNIVFAVNAHRKALQFVVLLENTFTVPFTIQILIVTVGMSITLVQFSIQLHNLAEATRYIVFIICQLIHLFCFSFQGQKLINHSLETCDKIFYSSWYEIPVNAQRLLLMVLRKSIIASTLTAGKIYVFSLESFTTVLQTSMSYFTVLSSFNE
ncbi:odorant receptor 4-like [Cataglyphis hispanica]|uniref:odorant receptor 4-like n=1 Tax=Cataglyphis hispanica TaxID=1086592 RepID=UPI0021805FB3|nr:odorant receptor 4-like [Cataglyphis hispanica]